MTDIDMLKAITDSVAENYEGGRWDAAEIAVNNVLSLLHEDVRPT